MRIIRWLVAVLRSADVASNSADDWSPADAATTRAWYLGQIARGEF